MSTAALPRARGWLADLHAHNHGEQLRIAREVQRKNLGLEQTDIPYPGAVSGNVLTTHNHYYPPDGAAKATPSATPTPSPAKRYRVIKELLNPDGTVAKELSRSDPLDHDAADVLKRMLDQ